VRVAAEGRGGDWREGKSKNGHLSNQLAQGWVRLSRNREELT